MPLVKLSQSLNFDTVNRANINLSVPDSMWSNSFNFHVSRESEQQSLDLQKKKLSIPVEKSILNDSGYPIEPRNNVISSSTPYNAALQTPFAGLPGMNFSYPGSLPLAPNSMLQQPPIGPFPPSCFQLPQQPEDIFRNAFDNQLANCFMRSHEANALVFPMIDSVSPELMMVLSAQQQILSQIPAYSQNHMLPYNNMINKPMENMNSRQMFFEKFISKPLTTVKSPISKSHSGVVAAENQQEAGMNSISQHNKLQNKKSLLYYKKYSEEPSTLVNSVSNSNSTHTKQTDDILQKKSFYPERKCSRANCNAYLPIGLNEISQTLRKKSGGKTVEEFLDQQEQNTNSPSNIDEKISNTNADQSSNNLFSTCVLSQQKEPAEEDLDVNVDVVSDDEVASTIEGKTNDDTLIYDVTNSEMEQVHFKKKMCRKFVPEEDETNACEPEVKRIRLSSPQVIKQQTANTEVQNKKVPLNKTKLTQSSPISNKNGGSCSTKLQADLDELKALSGKVKLSRQPSFSTPLLDKPIKNSVSGFKIDLEKVLFKEKVDVSLDLYRNSVKQQQASSESCEDVSDDEYRFNDQISGDDVTDSSSAEDSDCEVVHKVKLPDNLKAQKVVKNASTNFVMNKPKFLAPNKNFAKNLTMFRKTKSKKTQQRLPEKLFPVKQATFKFKSISKNNKHFSRSFLKESKSIKNSLKSSAKTELRLEKPKSNESVTPSEQLNSKKCQNKRKQKRPIGRKPETFVLSAKVTHRAEAACESISSTMATTENKQNLPKNTITGERKKDKVFKLTDYSDENCNSDCSFKSYESNKIKISSKEKNYKIRSSSEKLENDFERKGTTKIVEKSLVLKSVKHKNLPTSNKHNETKDISTVSLTNNGRSGVVMGSSSCSMGLFTKNENCKVKRPTTFTKFSLEKAIPNMSSITCGIGRCELVTASSVSNKKHQSRVWSRGQNALDVKARKQQEEWRNMKLSDFCMPGSRTKF